MQLKALIRNLSREKGVEAEALLRSYIDEVWRSVSRAPFVGERGDAASRKG